MIKAFGRNVYYNKILIFSKTNRTNRHFHFLYYEQGFVYFLVTKRTWNKKTNKIVKYAVRSYYKNILPNSRLYDRYEI
jgi:hypothetical protein